MIAYSVDDTVVHDDDLIRVDNGIDPLGDDEYGRIGNLRLQTLPDQFLYQSAR